MAFLCVCDHCDAAIASLYCHSDGVFLCAACDQAVHSNKIASKHIRVPHTACPLHAYTEAKNKGRARDLPLVGLPQAPAAQCNAPTGQLTCAQSSVSMPRHTQGSFVSETGLAPAQNQGLPRACTDYGQHLAGASHFSASHDFGEHGAAGSSLMPASSDVSYQVGTYDSLDKSVRGGRALVSMLADFGVASASSIDGKPLQHHQPVGGVAGEMSSTCSGFDASHTTSMPFGSLKSSMTQTLLQQPDTGNKGSALAQQGPGALAQLPLGVPAAAPIPIHNRTSSQQGVAPFLSHCIMSDPVRAAGSFLGGSVDLEGSVHAGVSSTTTPVARLAHANTASPTVQTQAAMEGRSSRAQCMGPDLGGIIDTSFSPHAAANVNPSLAAIPPGSSAPAAGTLSAAVGHTFPSPHPLPGAAPGLTSLSAGTRSFDRRQPFNIEPAPPSVIEAKARALINSSSRTQQPAPSYDVSQLVTRIERPDGSIREIDIERAAQLHRYRQKRIARMKALAEGQKKVRHEGKKALADVRPRNKGRFTKVGSTDNLMAGDLTSLMHSGTSDRCNSSVHGAGAAGAALGIGSVDSGMLSGSHHFNLGSPGASGGCMGGMLGQGPGMLAYNAAVAMAAAEHAMGLRRAMSCNSVPFPLNQQASGMQQQLQQRQCRVGSLDMHGGSSSALGQQMTLPDGGGSSSWGHQDAGGSSGSGRSPALPPPQGAHQLPLDLCAAMGAALNEGASLTITDQELAALGVGCDGMMAMMMTEQQQQQAPAYQRQQLDAKSPDDAARSEQSADSTHGSARGGGRMFAPRPTLSRLMPGGTAAEGCASQHQHLMAGSPSLQQQQVHGGHSGPHSLGHLQQGMAMDHCGQNSQSQQMDNMHIQTSSQQHAAAGGSDQQGGAVGTSGMTTQLQLGGGGAELREDDIHMFADDDVFADQHVSGLLEALLDEHSPDMPFGFLG